LDKGATNSQNFVYSAHEVFDLNREEFIGLLIKEVAEKPELTWEAVQETGFKKQFEWSLEQFSNQLLKKTVPVILQSSKSNLSSKNKIWLLLQLLLKKNFGWTYALFDGEVGMIGHTPEILINWNAKEQNAQTAALAGTLSNSEGHKEKILQDPKIRQEHEYVVDDILLKISGLKIEKFPTEAIELKHLIHLYTGFKISINNIYELFKIIQNLHPTAAMGVYPSHNSAFDKFSRFEIQKKRQMFAAPFGFINDQGAQLVVAIRNILFNESYVHLFSGCGVTKGSQYDKELEELEQKRNSVKKMLGLMND
jgi:menaquinone-specific isochorismate synthase